MGLKKREPTGSSLGKKLLRSGRLVKASLGSADHPIFSVFSIDILTQSVFTHLRDTDAAQLARTCRYFYHHNKKHTSYFGAVTFVNKPYSMIRALRSDVKEAHVGPVCPPPSPRPQTVWSVMGQKLESVVKLTVEKADCKTATSQSWVNELLLHLPHVETIELKDCSPKATFEPTYHTIRHVNVQRIEFSDEEAKATTIVRVLDGLKNCPLESVNISTDVACYFVEDDAKLIKKKWPTIKTITVDDIDFQY